MLIGCSFQDCKVFLVTSLTHVSSFLSSLSTGLQAYLYLLLQQVVKWSV